MNSFNYSTFYEFQKKFKSSKLKLTDFIITREIKMFGVSKEQILKRLNSYIKTMKHSIEKGKKLNKQLVCINNESIKLQKNKQNILGNLEYEVLTAAIAVAFYNCSMGKIIACPTAGSCGIMPGVLIPLANKYNFSDEEIIDSLIVAGEIGRLIANKTTISGAAAGCMAECGVSAAMAAAAAVYCFNGNINQIFDAATLALKNNLGLVCDPVAGLVEVPCVKRNGFKAIEALAAAQLALAGIKSAIPIDEVLEAMKEIADDMNEKYKETSTGGLAVTPTGLKYKEKLNQKK